MTPLLHPFLVNGRFGDPAVFVDYRFERRAFLFDLGDISALAPRQLLRVTDVFVSHMHVDHLIGFDHLLRLLIGRRRTVRMFGPAGLIDAIGHKLAAYTWNLVERYADELVFEVTEIHGDGSARTASFRMKQHFARDMRDARPVRDGEVHAEDAFVARCAVLDHGIPCLGFALQERAHVNVWTSRLEAKGLAVGPWLRELKRAVLDGRPDGTPVQAGERGPTLTLGELKRDVLSIVPGQKIAYVTDVAPSDANARAIVELAHGADILFIEAAFAAGDAAMAGARRHLTTVEAAAIARRAGARRLEPFHFSTRYEGREAEMLAEVEDAFAAGSGAGA